LYELLSQRSVSVETARGDVVLHPQPRPISALPLVFWFQIVCGLIALLTGASVYVFKRDSAAARSYAVTGVGFLLITFSAAVYSGRELAVDGELFRLLSVINHLSTMLFSAGFLGLFLRYPAQLGHHAIPRLLWLVFLLIWLLDTAQWLPGTDWGIRIPVIVGLCVSGVLGFMQWRRSRHEPVARAALKWFMLSVYMGGVIFVSLIFVTVWLGLPAPLSQGYAFGVVTAMYLGVAIGITRYRLFDLDRWWFNVWLWMLAGVLLVALDILFVYALQFTQGLALGLALALMGGLYLPMRQWLFSRLMPGRARRLEELYPQLLHLGLESARPEALARSWRRLLQDTFDPLHITELKERPESVLITDDGLALDIPGIADQPALRVSYHGGGQRLFSPYEAQLAQVLRDLAQRAVHDRHAYERGAQVERERIARDLHDDIGGRLLTLTHRATDPALVELARDALRDLRAVVANLSMDSCQVVEAVAEWLSEAQLRCQAAGVNLRWDDHALEEAHWLTAHQRINLQRVLREALSNALRHAQAGDIEIGVAADARQFSLWVRDSGGGLPDTPANSGHGLANMRRRMDELGGSLQIDAQPGQGVCVTARLPWPVQA
jgi:signal transduction histidine kinase